MAPRKPPRTPRARRFSLYWVTTDDADEDCFVVAASASSARRFFAGVEGYDGADVEAELIVDLPRELQDEAGWKEVGSAHTTTTPDYASDEILTASGVQVAAQRSDERREELGVVARDYVFEGRHFRAGDVVTNARREAGAPEPARIAAFSGGRSSMPDWWDWELELTPHLEKRMEDRDFTEVDLRGMLQGMVRYREDVVEDRFVIETRFRGRPWEVVVEPDPSGPFLVVVTAYGVDR